jgi:hypothetical protein
VQGLEEALSELPVLVELAPTNSEVAILALRVGVAGAF